MKGLLTVNGGSSSLKCAIFDTQQEPALQYRFKLGNIMGNAHMCITDSQNNCLLDTSLNLSDVPEEVRHQACLQAVIDWLESKHPETTLVAIGHRVVHGGETYSAPMIIDDKKLADLTAFNPLAPLHQPYNLKLIEACQVIAPELPQIACFDTMFHVGQPKVERYYALPRAMSEAGIHRYGFHGLSYEFIVRRLNELGLQQERTIICHLGAGASMCGTLNGQSQASSMGFSAVDGLPMGNRTGNIDPGVLLYLQRNHQMDTDALEHLLYKESGWFGVSGGISSDMQELHQADHPNAEDAIDMFAYRAALEIGRLAAALGGVDQIVFTGGVGENDANVRARIMQRCHWLGLRYDEQSNQQNAIHISESYSSIRVNVIPTDEEMMIATHILECLADHKPLEAH